MKIATQAVFAFALMFSVVAPSLSHAAYFVDQTKTWALEPRAQDVMDKLTSDKAAKVSRERTFEFYGTGNTSVPGIGIDKDDSRTLKSR